MSKGFSSSFTRIDTCMIPDGIFQGQVLILKKQQNIWRIQRQKSPTFADKYDGILFWKYRQKYLNMQPYTRNQDCEKALGE